MPKKSFDWYNYWKVLFDPLNIQLAENEKLAVIGDIHEKWNLFIELMDKLNKIPNIKIVSVGDVYDKGDGPREGNNILTILLSRKNCWVVQGNHEVKKIKRKDDTVPWKGLELLPKVLSFVFEGTNKRITALHAGVSPQFTWEDLKYNEQVVYIRDLDENFKMIKSIKVIENNEEKWVPEKSGGTEWHQLYDGRFGYIASGHAIQKDGIPKFYQHSCNLDTGAYETGILTAAIFDKNGLFDVIQTTL